MADTTEYLDWVDRYVQETLSTEEEAEFEQALMEDPALQDEVEAALGIRRSLQLDTETHADATGMAGSVQGKTWASFAMAASVLLAAVSTTLYWRASIQLGDLEGQLDSLRGPQTSVLSVPIDIMRSSGQAPDVIIQKPPAGLLILDVELSALFRKQEQIHFSLQTESGEIVQSWNANPGPNGRSVVALPAAEIPDGRMRLLMQGTQQQVEESRLLEFRPAGQNR